MNPASFSALELVFALRFDRHSALEAAVLSPRLALKWRLPPGTVIRAALSYGFKAPQVFDEDLRIQTLGADRQRVIRNAPDLREEHSLTLAGGAEFAGSGETIPWRCSIQAFRTELQDAYVLDPPWDPGDPSADLLFVSRNGEGALSAGAELELALRPLSRLEFQGGITVKRSRRERSISDSRSSCDRLLVSLAAGSGWIAPEFQLGRCRLSSTRPYPASRK